MADAAAAFAPSDRAAPSDSDAFEIGSSRNFTRRVLKNRRLHRQICAFSSLQTRRPATTIRSIRAPLLSLSFAAESKSACCVLPVPEFVLQRQLTTNAVGRLVGVSERTVANWIDRNYLPAFRTPGGHRRVDPRALAEFLQKRGMPVPPSLIERVSILIVEDDLQVGETMRNWLVQADEGFEVRLASGGVQALLTIGAQKPKLVLLDVMMPDMDGVEVCKKIKADPAFSDIEILFVTARYDLDPDQLRSTTGASGVLQKPLKKVDLCRKVSTILGRDIAAVVSD